MTAGRIEDLTGEEECEYREACLGTVYELLDFYLGLEGGDLESLAKLSTGDLALLATAVDLWREEKRPAGQGEEH